MIKDRPQKKAAAKFCAAQGIVPFLEVVVTSQTGLEEVPFNITDIDVLGIDVGRSGKLQRVLFDCKTEWRLSGINRALWAGGLKSFVSADRAFIIQKKAVPYSHKLAASTFNVDIHTETTFDLYANSITVDFARDVTYLDNLDAWDTFGAISKQYSVLRELISRCSAEYALEGSGPRGVRHGLSALIKSAPELDPAKPHHRFLFGTFLSGFLLALTLCTSALKDIFQFSMERGDFERTVRYFIWEGRDNYLSRRGMKAALDRVRGQESSAEFDLPGWDKFLAIMRSFLDAPDALTTLAFLAKEIAFRRIGAPRPEPDEHLRELFKSNNRARQFIFTTAEYLVSAAALPKEFSKALEADINGLVSPSAPSPSSEQPVTRLI